MKGKICVILVVLFLMLSGCTQASNPQPSNPELEGPDANQGENELTLDFKEVTPFPISLLTGDLVGEVLNELKLDDGSTVKLFKNKSNDQISGSIQVNEKVYLLEDVSMEGASNELFGIEEVEVLGKKAVKIYGILGANYGLSYYWFYELEQFGNSIIKVEGGIVEIDLDNNGTKEIISSMGTVAETSIYLIKEDKIMVSNINESIDAQAVYFLNRDTKVFEVYFGPNNMEHYYFSNGSLIK